MESHPDLINFLPGEFMKKEKISQWVRFRDYINSIPIGENVKRRDILIKIYKVPEKFTGEPCVRCPPCDKMICWFYFY